MSVDVAWFPDYGHLMAGIFLLVSYILEVSIKIKIFINSHDAIIK